VSLLLKDAKQSDDALMARAQAGDTTAFGLLYDRHAARGLRVARAICRDLGSAEDVVQESFLAIWRGRASYRPGTGSFQAWAMTIVKNRALDSLRSTAVRPQTQSGVSADDLTPTDSKSVSPQDEVLARSERDALLASLRQLPEAQAEVIVLAFYGELSHSEIAAQLDLPAGTIKGRMRLGLEKLRQEMRSDPQKRSGVK
jgi:RNA polymerase sigma-70 factor, ECF subfamily